MKYISILEFIIFIVILSWLGGKKGTTTVATTAETVTSEIYNINRQEQQQATTTTNHQRQRSLDEDINNNHRRLTIFAGPHKTSETSIEEFLYTYCNGPGVLPGVHDALNDWLWPQIPSDDELLIDGSIGPQQIFQRLVLDSENSEVQEALLTYIEDQYNANPNTNIILGSEEFDRVGHTPWSHTSAINAVVRVKNRLQMKDSHITIVLLYKTPRIDQWLAMFNFESLEIPPEDNDDAYTEYICDQQTTDKRWETLHTAMNTLWVAKEYKAQGWDVVLIDMGGVDKIARKSIEHVLGCDVLNVKCDSNGFIEGWEDFDLQETFDENSQIYDTMGDRIFKSLSDKQEYDLENLFRMRDCNHIDILDDDDDDDNDDNNNNNGIQILYRDTILMGCDDDIVDKPEGLMTALLDNDFILEAIRSQKDCSNEPMNLRDVLNGQTTVDEEDSHYKHKSSDNKFESYNNNDSNGKKHHLKWIIPLVVFAVVGIAIWYRSEISDRIDRSHQYGGMPFVIEATRFNTGRNSSNQQPNLSMLT